MEPKDLKENFSEQLEKLNTEIGQLRQALAQRQELALSLRRDLLPQQRLYVDGRTAFRLVHER